MFCLLCKKNAVKTAQNKEESAFTQTPSLRLKYDILKAHHNSDRLSCMLVFHKEEVEKKEVAKDVLEKAFAVAYFLGKEHVANRSFFNL